MYFIKYFMFNCSISLVLLANTKIKKKEKTSSQYSNIMMQMFIIEIIQMHLSKRRQCHSLINTNEIRKVRRNKFTTFKYKFAFAHLSKRRQYFLNS